MAFNDTADPKRPSAELFHKLDARAWLPEGATLAGSVTVSVSPPGELLVDQCSAADGYINYRVRGGVAGRVYLARFSFTTADGLWADDWTIRYRVR